MWTTVLVVLALAHAGQSFSMFGFNVPPAPEPGTTVTIETDYRLGRGEYIKKMKWYKDDVVFLSYAERPEKFLDWTPVPGVNVDRKASSHKKVVLKDVGDETSGQYTLEVQVHGPGGNVGNIVNGQYMSVGGADTIGTRFGGNSGGGGGGTFFQSSNFGGPNFPPGFPFNNAQGTGDLGPDTLGTRNNFQSSNFGPVFGPGFPFNNVQGSSGGTTFQSSSTGDLGPDTLGTRTSFQSSSSSAGGVAPDTLGTRTSFQSASAGGNTAFQGSGPEGSFQSAGGAFQGTGSGGSFQSAGGAFQGTGPDGSFLQSAGGAIQGTGPGGSSFQSSTSGGGSQTAFTGTNVGPLGVRSSFQSASSSGEAGPGPALAVQGAMLQAQAQLQNAANQINQLQAVLANLG